MIALHQQSSRLAKQPNSPMRIWCIYTEWCIVCTLYIPGYICVYVYTCAGRTLLRRKGPDEIGWTEGSDGRGKKIRKCFGRATDAKIRCNIDRDDAGRAFKWQINSISVALDWNSSFIWCPPFLRLGIFPSSKKCQGDTRNRNSFIECLPGQRAETDSGARLIFELKFL